MGDLVQIWSQALLGHGFLDLYKWRGHAHYRGQERPQKGYFGIIFKNVLLWNYRPDFKIISQKGSLGDPLPSLFKSCWFVKKHGRHGAELIFLIWTYSNLRKSSSLKLLAWFQNNFTERILEWPSTKLIQIVLVRRKTWSPGGGAYFCYMSI